MAAELIPLVRREQIITIRHRLECARHLPHRFAVLLTGLVPDGDEPLDIRITVDRVAAQFLLRLVD